MPFITSEAEEDAVQLINNWTPESDVWALKHGRFALVSSTALTAGYINHKFRKALKMRNFAFFSTYVASVCIPAVFSPVLHGLFVISPALTREKMCPVCLETRSSLLQVCSSVAYPMLLSPIACFQFADRYMTAAIPRFWPQPQLLLKKYLSIVKPMTNKLLVLIVFNMALGAGLIYAENENMMTVAQKLEKMEQVVTASVSPERLQQIQREAKGDDSIRSEPKVPLSFR